MARDLLFEIGVEEIPSAYMSKALRDLETLAAQKFTGSRLSYEDIKVFATPRRLTLYISGLEEKQQYALIENRGPKRAIAYDENGIPSKACQGFARGQGMNVDELEIRDVDGIEYIFAVKKELGQPAIDMLPDILKDLIHSLVFPKSMRWGYGQMRFARPIRWLLLLFGEEAIEVEIENVKSARLTYGHRFLAKEPLVVDNPARYFELLQDNYVIIDQTQRKALIWDQVQNAAWAEGGEAMENEELLEEINYLVEYPQAFYGEYSSSYLDVPPEVLTTSMIEHQRYFPVFDDQGNLMAGFIGVRNGIDYCLDIVKAGNERVIKARLEDALFFWKEDTKKPLQDMVPGLANVLFHERLGTIMDKVERISSLACFIGKEISGDGQDKIKRAAYLCKADLVSSMVYEFPELQGVMGRYYALKCGEDVEVCDAIFEHYLPRFAGDEMPATNTGIALSIAEKVDNLVGCYAIGIKTTGSQDPYALRRQALGIVNIILNTGICISLNNVLTESYKGFINIKPEQSLEDTIHEVMDFILQRMRGVLLEKGISYDVIDAVLRPGYFDLMDIYERARYVQEFKASPDFEDFSVVFNRANNLSKKWEQSEVNKDVLIDESEILLYSEFLKCREKAYAAVELGQYDLAMQHIAGLREMVDNFFEAVMVMVEDKTLKAARLGLLKSIANLCRFIADFGNIVQ